MHTTTQKLMLQGGLILLGALVVRSEEHTSELQSQSNLVCRLLLEKKNTTLICAAEPVARSNSPDAICDGCRRISRPSRVRTHHRLHSIVPYPAMPPRRRRAPWRRI